MFYTIDKRRAQRYESILQTINMLAKHKVTWYI